MFAVWDFFKPRKGIDRHSERSEESLFVSPGNANLPIGVCRTANREIGVPGILAALE